MNLMKIGAIVSVLGALISLISVVYIIFLSPSSSGGKIVQEIFLGIPVILYFTIIGAVTVIVGLILFKRTARGFYLETATIVGRTMQIFWRFSRISIGEWFPTQTLSAFPSYYRPW